MIINEEAVTSLTRQWFPIDQEAPIRIRILIKSKC